MVKTIVLLLLSFQLSAQVMNNIYVPNRVDLVRAELSISLSDWDAAGTGWVECTCAELSNVEGMTGAVTFGHYDGSASNSWSSVSNGRTMANAFGLGGQDVVDDKYIVGLRWDYRADDTNDKTFTIRYSEGDSDDNYSAFGTIVHTPSGTGKNSVCAVYKNPPNLDGTAFLYLSIHAPVDSGIYYQGSQSSNPVYANSNTAGPLNFNGSSKLEVDYTYLEDIDPYN